MNASNIAGETALLQQLRERDKNQQPLTMVKGIAIDDIVMVVVRGSCFSGCLARVGKLTKESLALSFYIGMGGVWFDSAHVRLATNQEKQLFPQDKNRLPQEKVRLSVFKGLDGVGNSHAKVVRNTIAGFAMRWYVATATKPSWA